MLVQKFKNSLVHLFNFSKKKQEGTEDIGRYFEYDSLSFDLKIGVTTSTLSKGSTMCLEIAFTTFGDISSNQTIY